MSSKQFYLLGEDLSASRDIELPESIDFEELQDIVASHFAIAEPRGINFPQLKMRIYLSSNTLQESALSIMTAD